MKEKRVINISRPVCDDAELASIQEVLKSGWLTQGSKVAKFERQFADFHRAQFAVSTTSCTTALHLGLLALGIGPGDEVLVPAFSWIASANVVLYCGAKPVFVDVDPRTYNLDPQDLKRARTTKTKAIIAVHLFGRCADMDALKDLLPGVKILEDAACAIGASYKGQFAGTLGDLAAFSLHPRKIITTGEGGVITTNDSALSQQLCKLRNHGAEISEEERHRGPKPYLLPDFNLLGFNYRMTDLQGAVGVTQMDRLPSLLKERRQWAKYYHEKLKHLNWLGVPDSPVDGEHSWQSYVCRVDEKKSRFSRNEIMEMMCAKGIGVRPGTHSIPHQNYYSKNLSIDASKFPGSKECQERTIAIPLHNCMSAEDYDYVVQALLELN